MSPEPEGKEILEPTTTYRIDCFNYSSGHHSLSSQALKERPDPVQGAQKLPRTIDAFSIAEVVRTDYIDGSVSYLRSSEPTTIYFIDGTRVEITDVPPDSGIKWHRHPEAVAAVLTRNLSWQPLHEGDQIISSKPPPQSPTA